MGRQFFRHPNRSPSPAPCARWRMRIRDDNEVKNLVAASFKCRMISARESARFEESPGGNMPKHKVAMLTAGGLAPCLSSAVGGLIERYSDIAPEIELVAYPSAYP